MSVDAGITFQLVCSNGPAAILDALLDSKWTARQEGWWCVPLDEDPSEWSLIGRGEVAKLLRAKMVAEQVFGIRLWWEGGSVGGEFLIFPSCEVVFSPSMNRVTLVDRTTDVSWYLARLSPTFEVSDGLIIESWTWRETS